MKRDLVDFFLVEDHHLAMHDRLLNWARYVRVKPKHWQAPIWRLGKSNTRQWHAPDPQEPTDPLDAMKIEKAVSALPEPHRTAIRWQYIYKTPPSHAKRLIKVTEEVLFMLVKDGRSMLKNRGA